MKLEINFYICLVITLVLLTLKLAGVMNVSWWIVTCPLWIPPLAIILTAITVGLMAGLLSLIK